jgi:hypothetical protein
MATLSVDASAIETCGCCRAHHSPVLAADSSNVAPLSPTSNSWTSPALTASSRVSASKGCTHTCTHAGVHRATHACTPIGVNRRLGSSRTADTSGAGASAATFFASSAAVTSRRCVILRVSAARECGGISSNPKLCQALQRTVAPLAVEHTCAHTSPGVVRTTK